MIFILSVFQSSCIIEYIKKNMITNADRKNSVSVYITIKYWQKYSATHERKMIQIIRKQILPIVTLRSVKIVSQTYIPLETFNNNIHRAFMLRN